MGRSLWFEAILVLLVIGLAGLLYWAIAMTPPEARGWETAINGSIDYMLVGGGDILYAFSCNNVTAIRSDGSLAWALDIPDEWQALNNWIIPLYTSDGAGYARYYENIPVADERSGYLYLFVVRKITRADIDLARSEDIASIDRPSKIMAIAPTGDVSWEYDFTVRCPADAVSGLAAPDPRYIYMWSTVAINASGDRVFLFHDYREDVLSEDGRLLFTLDNVSAPASVDSRGLIFTVGFGPVADDESAALAENTAVIGDYPSGWLHARQAMPTGIVTAHDSNGSVLWSRDVGERAVRPALAEGVWREYNTLPLMANDTLYVPLNNGVAALDMAGNLKWTRHVTGGIYSLFHLMPVDSKGYVYLEEITTGNDISYVYTIAPDGNLSMDQRAFSTDGHNGRYYMADLPLAVAGKDGIVYAIGEFPPVTGESFSDSMSTLQFGADTIKAIEVRSGRVLWSFTVPAADRHAVILNESNVHTAVRLTPESCGGYPPNVEKRIQVYPGSDVTYLDYDFAIFDYPVVYGESRCFYARGIYALDPGGRLRWGLHPDGFVDRAAAGNSTIYYLTRDGRIGGNTAGIAAGITLTALAYLFLRFFAMGTVVRARSRLDRNENRNDILGCIADHPGLTATDLARSLGMNKGTVRYHLFILTMNHKIITHREDDRYLRYFRNADTYSPEDRTLVSLMRREPLRRTLGILAARPGLSGSALARELGISPTAANRHIALLAGKGIIEPSSSPDQGNGYAISKAYREWIGRMMDCM